MPWVFAGIILDRHPRSGPGRLPARAPAARRSQPARLNPRLTGHGLSITGTHMGPTSAPRGVWARQAVSDRGFWTGADTLAERRRPTDAQLSRSGASGRSQHGDLLMSRIMLRGRDGELATVMTAVRSAASTGQGAMILITGEPGIGKSALLGASLADPRGPHRLRCRHGQSRRNRPDRSRRTTSSSRCGQARNPYSTASRSPGPGVFVRQATVARRAHQRDP